VLSVAQSPFDSGRVPFDLSLSRASRAAARPRASGSAFASSNTLAAFAPAPNFAGVFTAASRNSALGERGDRLRRAAEPGYAYLQLVGSSLHAVSAVDRGVRIIDVPADGRPVVVKLAPTAGIQGKFVTADGKPVADASVWVEPAEHLDGL
jgi:hypothetical protein